MDFRPRYLSIGKVSLGAVIHSWFLPPGEIVGVSVIRNCGGAGEAVSGGQVTTFWTVSVDPASGPQF